MPRNELEAVLDYILNKAEPREFEVIVKAVQRRARDQKAFERIGGEGPEAMARRMAGELQRDVGATMESVRGTVRNFITEIIRKNAPEISEADLQALLDECAPPEGAARKAAPKSPLPPEALLGMVRSFAEYSLGSMAPSRSRELWESNSRWQEEYWAAFPAEVKALVKAFLEGSIDEETFGKGLLSVLGL